MFVCILHSAIQIDLVDINLAIGIYSNCITLFSLYLRAKLRYRLAQTWGAIPIFGTVLTIGKHLGTKIVVSGAEVKQRKLSRSKWCYVEASGAKLKQVERSGAKGLFTRNFR